MDRNPEETSTMRIVLVLIALLLAACTPAEKEVLTTSVDVNQSELMSLFSDIDSMTDNALPVNDIHELAVATPMDDELQERFSFVFKGSDEDVQIHVWREQVDWVHLYFSTTSEDLIAALDATNATHARE
jgi:hypothetical protein